jgi:hypothetical protein
MSANINQIINGEAGLSVRNKLNALIDKAQDTSGSLNIISASFSSVSASYTAFSSSYVANSASFSASLNNISSSLVSVSASFVNVSASYAALSSSYNTGSFTGSFTGKLEGSASYALSSSNATTASFVVSASYALSSSNALSASFATTASFAVSASQAISASFATTASFAHTSSFLQYSPNTNEVHVSTVEGVDAIGRGTLLYPYKTINYALARIGVTSRVRLIIHRGQYAESLNLTATNMHLVGYNSGNGSLVEILGTVTVAAGSSSTRISNIRVNALRHTGAGTLFTDQVTCTTSASFGSSYAEIVDSRFECPSGISHTAGALFVFGSTFSPLTTSGSAAISYLKDNIGIVQPTLTAGSMVIINCQVTSAVSGSPAINTSANTLLNLVNSSVSTPTGTPTRINIGGFFSYDDVVFEKPGSTLGVQVPITARFQNIDTNLLQVTGSASVSGSATITGNTTVGGNLTVAGKLTAREIFTQFESASIIYSSGSTKFGDTEDDTHQFTGSLLITGSLVVNSVQIASASIASGSIASASFAETASYVAFNGVDGLVDYTSSISASIVLLSSSFETVSSSFEIVSSSFQVVSASYEAASASFSSSITLLSASFESVSASYADASASFSSSIVELSSSIASLSSSFIDFSGSYMSGSFSGSFEGDGSKLTGLSAGFPYTGSAEISGSLTVTGSVNVSGSLIVNNIEVGSISVAGGTLINGSGSLIVGGQDIPIALANITSKAAIIDYYVYAATGSLNARLGTISAHWSDVINESRFNEVSTSDFGDTSEIVWTVVTLNQGTDVGIRNIGTLTKNWIVKWQARLF